jgi:hypothetical protein
MIFFNFIFHSYIPDSKFLHCIHFPFNIVHFLSLPLCLVSIFVMHTLKFCLLLCSLVLILFFIYIFISEKFINKFINVIQYLVTQKAYTLKVIRPFDMVTSTLLSLKDQIYRAAFHPFLPLLPQYQLQNTNNLLFCMSILQLNRQNRHTNPYTSLVTDTCTTQKSIGMLMQPLVTIAGI